MTEIIYREESYLIIGACMRVHKELGGGFLEAVYHEALEKELSKSNIPYESQKKLSLFYGGERLKKFYKADFLCYEKIVLEIKAVDYLNQNMQNTLFNYLKATKMKLGLLVNFGKRSLEYKRILNPNVKPSQ